MYKDQNILYLNLEEKTKTNGLVIYCHLLVLTKSWCKIFSSFANLFQGIEIRSGAPSHLISLAQNL